MWRFLRDNIYIIFSIALLIFSISVSILWYTDYQRDTDEFDVNLSSDGQWLNLDNRHINAIEKVERFSGPLISWEMLDSDDKLIRLNIITGYDPVKKITLDIPARSKENPFFIGDESVSLLTFLEALESNKFIFVELSSVYTKVSTQDTYYLSKFVVSP